MSLLAVIPLPWRIALGAGLLAALGAVGGLAARTGYRTGFERAEAMGRAELAEVLLEQEKASSQAMREVNARLQAQARGALAAVTALESERTNNARAQADLRAQIAAVTHGGGHTFSPDFVRVFNRAIGAGTYNVPAAHSSGSAPGEAGAGQAAGAGLLAAVSEADVLAFIAYYGERTRNLEAQVNAWIDLAEGWE